MRIVCFQVYGVLPDGRTVSVTATTNAVLPAHIIDAVHAQALERLHQMHPDAHGIEVRTWEEEVLADG